MRPDDQYPSTGDMPPRIMGAQDDPVLEILERAYVRVRDNWTAGQYLNEEHPATGASCALGSIMAESGWIEYVKRETDCYDDAWIDVDSYTEWEQWEDTAKTSAVEAIQLLNVSALKLWPQIVNGEDHGWNEPIEALNQERLSDEEWEAAMGHSGPDLRQVRVLAAYEDAMAARRGE